MTTFADAATKGSELLAGYYWNVETNGGNYWFLGNALHAFLRSRVASGKQDGDRLLEYAFIDVYTKVSSDPNLWKDDHGWWGGAFCYALHNRTALGYRDPLWNNLFRDLLGEAGQCWGKLAGNSRPGVAYSKQEDHAQADSDITGGVANSLTDPGELVGRNTVTNLGFWLLSLELAKLDGEAKFAQAAKTMTQWFGQWLGRGAGPKGVKSPAGLVLERPTGNGTYADWCWTGDQGVMMVDLLLAGSDRSPNSPAAAIAAAVIAHMTTNGILTENLDFRGQFGYDTVDYATGKGVLMRHLGDACEIIGATWRDKVCAQFIRANASAVWSSRGAGGQIPFNWSPPPPKDPITDNEDLQPLVFQASGLDAISVAARFWPNDPIV
jgi:hypothetical protein